MKIEVEVSRLILEDVFRVAIEDGNSYWCEIMSNSFKKIRKVLSHEDEPDISLAILKAVLDHDITVFFEDVVKNQFVGDLRKENFQSRLNELANSDDYKSSLFNYLGGSGDANDADIIFQYLCLGDVVYG